MNASTISICLFLLLCSCSSNAPTWDATLRMVREDFPAARQIQTEAVAAWLADNSQIQPVLYDVRSEEEYAVSHIHGALRVDSAADILVELSQPIICYCSVGYRSADMAEQLQERGYQQVFNMEGSLFQWANEGRLLVDAQGSVETVHPYNESWGSLLLPERVQR